MTDGDEMRDLTREVARLVTSVEEQTRALVDANETHAREIEAERSARKRGNIAIALALVALLAGGSWATADQWRSDRAACRRSIETRDDIRRMAVGMVDEVAVYADLDRAQKRDLLTRAEERAGSELPTPDC